LAKLTTAKFAVPQFFSWEQKTTAFPAETSKKPVKMLLPCQPKVGFSHQGDKFSEAGRFPVPLLSLRSLHDRKSSLTRDHHEQFPHPETIYRMNDFPCALINAIASVHR
jgi:hypothetical protein